MSLLKVAMERQRWDLAAHTIVLATIRVMNKGVRANGRKARGEKSRAKGQ